MKSKTLIYTCTILTLAWACGGDDKTGNDGGNDSGNGNDSTAGDSGGNDSGGDSATDSGPKPQKANYGNVSFGESKIQNSTTYTASAAFFATPDGGTGTQSGCTGTKVGACCYTPPSDAGAGPTPTAVGAGGITLKDGTTTIGTMSPNGTTYTTLTSGTTNTLKWTDGDKLDVSAAGDTVHAFSGSVTSVALFAGVTPALSFTTPIVISKGQNFTITWTAGTGEISLALTQTAAQGLITCDATTDTGTMTVDHSLLANFTAVAGAISLTRMNTADASPDNADITLSSSTTTSGTTTYTN